MIGTTVSKYRFVGQLGRGSMGVVYKAIDETLDREVAIKVLNPELADPHVIKRFKSEATTLARLNHAGIATLYELFHQNDDFLIVMEFVRGETLEKLAQRMGPLTPEHAAFLVDEILAALRHAHRAGVVHCDVKPANVMLTEDGSVKILDFGTARVRGTERATVDRYMMGTPAYMAPEQVAGEEIDGRADLYAVGVILYRLLTGTLPFHAENVMAMLQKQMTQPPAPLDRYRDGLPGWCEATVQRALAKKPADRFQTADEFRETLHHATGIITKDLARVFASSGINAAAAIEGFSIPVPPAPTLIVDPDGQGTIAPPLERPVAIRRLAQAGGSVVLLTLAVVWYTRTFYPEPIPMPLPSMVVTPLSGPLAADASPRSTMPPRENSTAVERPAPVPAAPPASAPPPAPVTPDPADHPLASTPTVAPTPAPPPPANKTFAAPFVFEARALIGEGDKQRERECRVVLADGKINVQAIDDHALLYALPYDAVASISYSRGSDPLWDGPLGPTRVARAGKGVLGVFRGTRHWVALRTGYANSEFLTLRLDNESEAKRAIGALQERTGHVAAVVAERK